MTPLASRITSYNVCYTKLLRVAALAGVPRAVIEQARQRLQELETAVRTTAVDQHPGVQPGLFDAVRHPLVDVLEGINPDDLTPRQVV